LRWNGSLFRSGLLVLFFSAAAFAVMGYHPGLEDDGIYLSAVQRDLNPALYPHDAAFFRLQAQATVFDKCLAEFVRCTGIPVAGAELLGQCTCILLIVFACWRIACLLFNEEVARWAGVAMVAAMFSLPVAGTALYLADLHLHPRNVATALILLAVWRVLAGRAGQAASLLAAGILFHPLMGAMGAAFCVILALALRRHPGAEAMPPWPAALVPLGWIFAPATPPWRKALALKPYISLYKWAWYEWLGALAPLLLFWLLWRYARRRSETRLARFALAVLGYGLLMQSFAFLVLTPPQFVRLMPLQPMRYLQLIYYFLALAGGALAGRHLLKAHAGRWAVYLVAINGAMLAAHSAQFSACPHLELPWVHSSNPWLQSFAWIRKNTPVDAYFAVGPYYLAAPGEDYHSFRALAERSQLADALKDTATVTLAPQLAPEWNREVEAQRGWQHFKLADFERLRREFGVDWVLVAYPAPAGLLCRWHNRLLSVCQVP